jgi:predicted regulator of Ras-like GTPase activity (Roadblock/LC7/MglB family)|uniref:Roadblock/LC7 domain-containing protein n=1 Tax=candidate division WOR-3 bacterium TaxID=2052148 RepID=A0A7V3VU48_UNCW3
MADDLYEEVKKIAEKIPGCLYTSLVGYDGISVAQHIIEADFDVNLYDAEVSSLLLTSKEIKKNLNLGMETELIWLTQKAFFIIQPLGEDYFIYACLKPTGSNPGVARIEINKAKPRLMEIIYPKPSS